MVANTGKNRVAWIDYSKGICIVGVVCLYASQYVQDAAGSLGWMQYWVDFARPFRMPAFFLISGLFLSRTIDTVWSRYLDTKVVHFFYFFALWTTIYFVLNLGLDEIRVEHTAPPHHAWEHYFLWYVEPFRMLWFIEMLPVFFLVTRLVKNVPWYLVLPVAGALQIAQVDTEFGQVNNFCERYVYFYAGYIFASRVFRLATWAERHVAASAALLLGWAIINEALVLAGHGGGRSSILLGFVGAGAVVVAGCSLSRSRWMAWLRYLGENSIVVFLSFFIFTTIAAHLLDELVAVDIGTRQLLATVISLLGPVLVFWLVRETPVRFLFSRPRWAHIPLARDVRADLPVGGADRAAIAEPGTPTR